jgi:hypothetical protein
MQYPMRMSKEVERITEAHLPEFERAMNQLLLLVGMPPEAFTCCERTPMDLKRSYFITPDELREAVRFLEQVASAADRERAAGKRHLGLVSRTICECIVCGVAFPRCVPNQKYCGVDCRNHARRGQRPPKARVAATMEDWTGL